jgi:hypothetical protein
LKHAAKGSLAPVNGTQIASSGTAHHGIVPDTVFDENNWKWRGLKKNSQGTDLVSWNDMFAVATADGLEGPRLLQMCAEYWMTSSVDVSASVRPVRRYNRLDSAFGTTGRRCRAHKLTTSGFWVASDACVVVPVLPTRSNMPGNGGGSTGAGDLHVHSLDAWFPVLADDLI